jgi:5-methylcytosine-specific restriction endonuclease McrA
VYLRRPHRALDEYQSYRQPLQQKWRPLILARDRSKCRVCGAKEDLEMAHLTDAVAFVRAAGSRHGVTFSYRWDNLLTLCGTCHGTSHSHRWGRDEVELRSRIQALQEELRRLRGWSSPFAVLPPTLVPPEVRPARTFHDVLRITPMLPFPTFAKYAADGGLVFGDQEGRPGQATLPGTLAAPA